MGRHVVLAVELLLADGAGVGLALKVGGHVVPVEVGRVGVGVVAHLAPVRVAVLDAEAADADGRGRVGGGRQAATSATAAGSGGVLIKVCQLGLNLLLELVGHEVGRRTGCVRVKAEAGGRWRTAANSSDCMAELYRRAVHKSVDPWVPVRGWGHPTGGPLQQLLLGLNLGQLQRLLTAVGH